MPKRVISSNIMISSKIIIILQKAEGKINKNQSKAVNHLYSFINRFSLRIVIYESAVFISA